MTCLSALRLRVTQSSMEFSGADYEELENAVLNAVTQSLSFGGAEHLRLYSEAQEDKIAAPRDANEHLRRQLILIGDSYADYAASCASLSKGSRRLGIGACE